MDVWVIQHDDYEIVGVASSEESAEEFIQMMVTRSPNQWRRPDFDTFHFVVYGEAL